MTLVGILYTFMGALLQSASYFFAAYALRHHKEASSMDVLCRSFIVMGVFAAGALAVLWHPVVLTAFPRYWYLVLAMIVTQMAGQEVFFLGQRLYDSSRMVPLLGLKLVFLPILYGYILHHATYGWVHWVAILITIIAAFLLNKSGGSLPFMALLIVLATCLIYTFTDTFIQLILETMKTEELSVPHSSMLSAAICYITLGVAMSPILLARKRQPWSIWIPSAAQGVAWFSSMLFLYSGYGIIGIVSGNIILNTRGLISIIFGAILAKLGMTELEEKVPLSVVIKRCVAALLMLAAIILFNKAS
jgi:hypothetical protein